MKKIVLVLVLVMGCFLAGCQTETSLSAGRTRGDALATPGETMSERDLRIRQIVKQQFRMFVDDWDTFWLLDHSTRLSPWHVDIGF